MVSLTRAGGFGAAGAPGAGAGPAGASRCAVGEADRSSEDGCLSSGLHAGTMLMHKPAPMITTHSQRIFPDLATAARYSETIRCSAVER
jgi:hypothetical protein